ncbi:MAG: TIGR01212 family radical SAM protein [Lachnospiraceae bacterium]|nr:TIGR01212 family radical SAM protein [Lachnospiraceae bacterium]
MITMNDYCQRVFGKKLYKLGLDAGFTCPNRDGKLDTRGCIFCSGAGSGDFTSGRDVDLDTQIEEAKKLVAGKYKGDSYIAYFQAFTNTYAPVEKLRELFYKAASHPGVKVISIATRPDCLQSEVIELLSELNKKIPVWVELGLQTVKESTAEYIRRGYELSVYDEAVRRLKGIGVHVITHIILGLPRETREDMLETVRYVKSAGSDGIKLQLLHVLKGTDLASDYEAGKFAVLSEAEYIDILMDCLKVIGDDMVVHRLTGDPPKSLLIAPMWSADKKRVINDISARIKDLDLR